MPAGETAMHRVLLPRWKWRQILVAVAIALVVWMLDFSGTFRSLDDMAYDACLRLTSRASTEPAQVLLVYVDHEHLTRSSTAPASLARALLKLGARKIGFTCPLPEPQADLLKLANKTGDIVLAREFHANLVDPDQLESSPVVAATADLPLGLVGLSPSSEGVYRSHFGSLQVAGSRSPSLEAILARGRLLDRDTIPEGDFRIAFRGPAGSLPHVDYESVVAGDLVSELVEGKVVLVGSEPDLAFQGISTPTTRGKAKMSLLEYHGHVLQTLLVARPIYALGPGSRFFLFVVLALICHLLFQTVRIKWGWALAGAFLLLNASVGLALLGWQSLWIPCVPPALIQIFIFAEVYQKKCQLSELAVSGVLLDQSIKLRRRRIPTGFYATDDPWSRLTSLIYQQFYLNRLIVLERPADSDRLQEVHAVDCRLEDIEEKRRDCRRWPYSAAFESKLPLRVDTSGYSLLAGQDPDEYQYLVRLAFNGEVLGFLVIGVRANYLETCPDFRLRLQTAADEFAALLHRWRWVRSQRQTQQSWRGMLTRIPEEEPFRELGRANHLLENRLARLEKTFENSDTAGAIYDLFGQLLMMNSRLSRLLHEAGLGDRNTSALELLCSLTGRDLKSCSNLLRQIVGDKQSTSVQIALDNPSRVFHLTIRPLRMDAAPAIVLPDEADPFQLIGIHIELIDGTPFIDMHDVKDRNTDRLCLDLSKNLDTVHRLVAELAHDAELPEKVQRVGESVEKNLVDAVTTLQACQSFIASDLVNQPGEGVPIDAAAALRRALDTIEQTSDRELDVRRMLPDVVGDVLANPRLIQPAFTALLKLLLSGAADKPVITVRAEEGIGDISFLLETAHVSASADELRKVLIDDKETSVEELRPLREVRDWVDQWGGRMIVSTRGDRGVVIKLVLKRHHWMNDPRPASSAQPKPKGTLK